MRVVSMDEASNLFRACFWHGDASFATATRLFKTRLFKCACARNRVRLADSTENRVRSTPNEIARFKLPSSNYCSWKCMCVLYFQVVCGIYTMHTCTKGRDVT